MATQSAIRYIAPGDGIQAALNDANAYEVRLLPGTHNISTTLAVPLGKKLIGEGGSSNCRILATSGIGTAIEPSGGALESRPGLSGSVSKGESFVTLSSSPGTFNAGRDALVLESTDLWNSHPGRPYYTQGEFCAVGKVVGNEVHFTDSLYDDYNSATTSVYRVPYAPVWLEGFRLDCNDCQYGIRLINVNGGCLRDVFVENANEVAVRVMGSYDILFDSCRVAQNAEVSGDRYGVAVAHGQKITFYRGAYQSVRHAITLGGGGAQPQVVCRNIVALDALIGTLGDLGEVIPQNFALAADHHGNTEYCGWTNCDIHGGVAVSGNHSWITGCRVYARVDNQGNYRAAIAFSEPKGFDFLINDNMIFCPSGRAGIDATSSADFTESSMDTEGTIKICNNTFLASGGTNYFIDLHKTITTQVHLLATNNTFRGRNEIIQITGTDAFDTLALIHNVYMSGFASNVTNGTLTHVQI